MIELVVSRCLVCSEYPRPEWARGCVFSEGSESSNLVSHSDLLLWVQSEARSWNVSCIWLLVSIGWILYPSTRSGSKVAFAGRWLCAALIVFEMSSTIRKWTTLRCICSITDIESSGTMDATRFFHFEIVGLCGNVLWITRWVPEYPDACCTIPVASLLNADQRCAFRLNR